MYVIIEFQLDLIDHYINQSNTNNDVLNIEH